MSTMTRTDIVSVRRDFANRIATLARVKSADLIEALAHVPREDFVGPGPRLHASSFCLSRASMLSRHTAVLVVIDAQRAFVDREGSVARTFGIDDAQPGMAALGRLCRFIAEHRSIGPTIFVRSEYRPGQFTNGDLDHGMAYRLCARREHRLRVGDGHRDLTARRRGHEAPCRRHGVCRLSGRDRAGHPGGCRLGSWWSGFSSRPASWHQPYRPSRWFEAVVFACPSSRR